MWAAKIRIHGEGDLIGSKTLKHKVTVSGYPIQAYPQRKKILAVIAGLVFGEPAAKKSFIEDLKTDSRVPEMEQKNDFVIALIEQPKWMKAFFNPYIIHLKPAIIGPDGKGTYEFGSWDRKKLENLVLVLKKHRDAVLLRFSEQSISNITLLGMLPELSRQQKKALDLAVSKGYYDYPRRIELAELAGLMRKSLSTYREHLRIAEKKVMPKIV